MEATTQPSQTLDRDTLAQLKDEEGQWKKNSVQDLSSEEWTEWFMSRLQGEDPYFPYQRGEYPQGANNLFFNLFRKLPEIDTEPASNGLCLYLEHLKLRHESDEHDVPLSAEVQQALELLLAVRARDTDARQFLRNVLRGFIRNDLLLNRETEEDPHTVPTADLHRDALVALSVLQRRGDTDDWDVWKTHRTENDFGDEHDVEFDPRFALTAFSGIALSAPTPSYLPEGMVTDLFRLVNESDQTLRPRHSLEALFVDRLEDREQVFETFAYLWIEVQDLTNSRERWEQVQTLLNRLFDDIPTYSRMRTMHAHIDLDREDTNENNDEDLMTGPWTEENYKNSRERQLLHN